MNMCVFLVRSHRTEIIDFCGSDLVHDIIYDVNGDDALFCIRKFENGEYGRIGTLKPIITRHPNIVRTILLGKKGLGLWVREWSQGIAEGLFTKHEIYSQFEENNILIPESIKLDIQNNIYKHWESKL